jgi:membrane associated rhomboid family serine protease
MIPIRDEIKTRRTPIITYLLIALNIFVFILQWSAGSNQEAFIYEYALIPANLTTSVNLDNVTDIFSSMFMHAGLVHLAGNMLYLWIFGDNVEDAMGRVKYLIFYLIGGIAAALAHTFINPNSQIPTVGASGAIAAVLGAYLVLYPRSRVLTFIPIGFFMTLRLVPAAIVLGLWFVLQLFSGVASIGMPDISGTAFWAHIGGFAAGLLLAKLFSSRKKSQFQANW